MLPFPFLRSWSLIAIASSVLFTSGVLVSCDRGPDRKSAEVSAAGAKPVKVAGADLNKFFPEDEGDYDVVFTAEKEGFSQAKLKNDGDELGTLSISDTVGNAEVVGKYDSVAMKIAGFPAIARGSKGTAVLAGRFQVQVRSTSDAFAASDREHWLGKFDLAGLAGLAGSAK